MLIEHIELERWRSGGRGIGLAREAAVRLWGSVAAAVASQRAELRVVAEEKYLWLRWRYRTVRPGVLALRLLLVSAALAGIAVLVVAAMPARFEAMLRVARGHAKAPPVRAGQGRIAEHRNAPTGAVAYDHASARAARPKAATATRVTDVSAGGAAARSAGGVSGGGHAVVVDPADSQQNPAAPSTPRTPATGPAAPAAPVVTAPPSGPGGGNAGGTPDKPKGDQPKPKPPESNDQVVVPPVGGTADDQQSGDSGDKQDKPDKQKGDKSKPAQTDDQTAASSAGDDNATDAPETDDGD